MDVIDLRTIKAALVDYLGAVLAGFTESHPDTTICSIGILGDGYSGGVLIGLDTLEHRAAQGAQWHPDGWDPSRPEAESVPDMEFLLAEFEFPAYPDMYEVDESSGLTFVRLDGTPHEVDFDIKEYELEDLVLPMLLAALEDLVPFAPLRRADRFVYGVQMHGSNAGEFRVLGSSSGETAPG